MFRDRIAAPSWNNMPILLRILEQLALAHGRQALSECVNLSGVRASPAPRRSSAALSFPLPAAPRITRDSPFERFEGDAGKRHHVSERNGDAIEAEDRLMVVFGASACNLG